MSKAIHDCVELSIWESVRVRPETEARLSLIRGADCPQRALRAAKHLRFHFEISKVTCERCPHYLDNGDPHVPDDEEAYALERPDEEFPRFLRLAREAEALVGRLEDNQLLSFRQALQPSFPPLVSAGVGEGATPHSLTMMPVGTSGHACPPRSSGPMALSLADNRRSVPSRW